MTFSPDRVTTEVDVSDRLVVGGTEIVGESLLIGKLGVRLPIKVWRNVDFPVRWAPMTIKLNVGI